MLKKVLILRRAEEKRRKEYVGEDDLLRCGLTLQEAEQQVNGFETLVSSLTTGHAHLPLPDVGQWKMTQDLLVC